VRLTPDPLTGQDIRQHPDRTFAVLALGGISYALMQSLVAPALPDIQHALGVSESSVSWVLAAYLVSASVATPIIGRLGDMHGKEQSARDRARAALRRDPDHGARDDAGCDAARARGPGCRGRDLPARLRDHPRRVSEGAGGGRDRADVGAARRRGGRRLRARGADRGQPLLPLPLLAAADPDCRRHRADSPARARVADPGAGPRQLARRLPDERRARARPGRRQPDELLALAVREDPDVHRHRRRGARALGPGRVPVGAVSSTCG
jgi:Major Facilitator Superfamily